VAFWHLPAAEATFWHVALVLALALRVPRPRPSAPRQLSAGFASSAEIAEIPGLSQKIIQKKRVFQQIFD
jgi:hypothetical protein